MNQNWRTQWEALTALPIEHVGNARALRGTPYPEAFKSFLSQKAASDAAAQICAWTGYAPTPLVPLTDLAAAANLGAIAYKDESGRFDMGSFKALGGAYAVRALAADREPRTLTVACATDGNHGRAVAWGAQTVGCRCVIYLHAGVSIERERAISRFGAEIRRVAGNYDASVRQAQQDAARNGWLVVSDTSYPGYDSIPCQVMQGYSLLAQEVLDQGFRPTHVFVQAGVGGLAAAITAHFWEAFGADRPRVIIVEPDRADCLFRSAIAGRPVVVEGALDTLMAGLACGEVSEIAWTILDAGADDFLTLIDAAAVTTMRMLAAGAPGTRPIVAGESATAGLAACLIGAARSELRAALGLSSKSRVLCIGTEGDTDPAAYEQLVGMSAAMVRRRAESQNGPIGRR